MPAEPERPDPIEPRHAQEQREAPAREPLEQHPDAASNESTAIAESAAIAETTGSTDYPTLREPFTATGEAFSVPLPEYPTLQETTMATEHEHELRGGPGRPGRGSGAGPARDLDPVSIGAGLVFFLLGGAYLLASGGHLRVNAGWTLSFLLLGLGLSGVVGGMLRARRNQRARARRDDW